VVAYCKLVKLPYRSNAVKRCALTVELGALYLVLELSA